MTKRLSPAIQREQRRTKVATNLLAGRSLREIAREIGSSSATVQRDAALIRKEWREEYLHDADEHIRQDLKRIDIALQSIWDAVEGGKLSAIDRMIRLLDQRAKYLGLYAPSRVEGELNINYLHQVRRETEIIAEYSEVVEDAAQRILSQHAGSQSSDPEGSLAPAPQFVGEGQNRHHVGLLPGSQGTSGMALEPSP